MSEALDAKSIRAIRTSLGMTETEFALLFGVTIRTVALWESGVVVPSRITAMVIRAESERAAAAARSDGGGAAKSRAPRRRGRNAARSSSRLRA
ncbi:helix-turn-helix domain-containing protein [Candidatus Binatia bacterium]|nr:helix-turn-helix domain-containing protein [Candidatus Binatia bacterium]